MSALRGVLSISSALALIGCSTTTKLLQQERAELLRVEAGVSDVATAAEAGTFRPAQYDMYLMLNSSVFDQILSRFDNTTVSVDAKGRRIEITLGSVRMAFRPGYPTLAVEAKARDPRSGVVADVVIDASLRITGDQRQPNSLFVELIATKIVPNIKWGPFQLSRWRFAQRLITLEALQLTKQIPKVQIPLKHEFAFGGPTQSTQVSVPTGDGYIVGSLVTPETATTGAIIVRHVLFLRNGVHVFADVEGL